jgi:hypothetical protein
LLSDKQINPFTFNLLYLNGFILKNISNVTKENVISPSVSILVLILFTIAFCNVPKVLYCSILHTLVVLVQRFAPHDEILQSGNFKSVNITLNVYGLSDNETSICFSIVGLYKSLKICLMTKSVNRFHSVLFRVQM